MSRKMASDLWRRLLAVAEEEVANVLRDLPGHLREAAQAVTLAYENAPSPALVSEGIEPDTLGLFVGEPFGDEARSSCPMPPEIILYLENLWDMAQQSEAEFREEVRATYLHELGHYLG